MTSLRFLLTSSLLILHSQIAAQTFAAEPVARAEVTRVVATLPVLKDFVQQVGGNRISVINLLDGTQSEDTYMPEPKDVLVVGEARMLVQIGLGSEKWVNGLIKNAKNPRLLVVSTSNGIPLLKNRDKRNDSRTFQKLGDPHIWLDPENAKLMVRQITEGLLKIDPVHKTYYMRNQAAYIQELDETQQRLMSNLKVLKNKKIVTHHAAWSYFARRFGFLIRGSIESQFETQPSPKHLAELIRKIKSERIRTIVSEPQLDPKLPQFLANETGTKVIILFTSPGESPGVEDYRSMIEYDVNHLITALND
jgi:zinc/manganese transport system substrate-binding protein